MEKIKIVFFATPPIALKTFECLLKSKEFNVLALVTQAPKPKGRGAKIEDSAVKKMALQYGIKVFETLKISKDEALISILKELKPAFFVTFAFGQILSQELLNIPSVATINVHPSLLPKYRGSNPIRACLLNGDCKTGISTAITVLALDEGDVILQEEIEIDENTNAIELEAKIREKAPDVLTKTLLGLVRCEINPCCQDGSCAIYTKKTTKEDKNISFCSDAQFLHNKIRALIGQYTCQAKFKGKIIKIIKSSFVKNDIPANCGEVLDISKKGILVKCDKNAILFEMVKPEGKGEMSAYAWSLGSKIKKGDCFNA